MRDALSLLDQAIAYGGGEVREAVVRTMLGAVDREYVYRIVDALVAGDGPALLAEVDAMAARSIAFAPALEELASLFHRIAVAQAVPAAASAMDDGERVAALAARLDAGGGAARLPDLRAGPRRPAARAGRGDRLLDDAAAPARVRARRRGAAAADAGPRAAATRTARAGDAAPPRRQPSPAPRADAPRPRRPRRAARGPPRRRPAAAPPRRARCRADDPPRGRRSSRRSTLPPMAAQLAAQTELKSIEGNVLTLALPAAHKHLADKAYADKLKAALEQATGRKWMLAFEVGVARRGVARRAEAARARRGRRRRPRRRSASEPFVRDVLARFDAKIRPDSIKPVS